jgi:hypothetical protein
MSFGDMLAKVHADIEREGWSSIGVFPSESDPEAPNFVYSIGFYEHDDHPEMLIAGVGHQVGHTILGGLYQRIADGERFEDGERSAGVLVGYDVLFRALPRDGRPANVARSYYGVNLLPVLQVVWPDADGRFPGEDGCDRVAIEEQDQERLRA